MSGVIDRLPDDLFRGKHHHVRHLVPHRLNGAITLCLDLLSCTLGNALGLLFGLLPGFLPHLLGELRCCFDEGLCSLASLVYLGFSILEMLLRRGSRLLGLLELLSDG